jgi:hypothetical protein
VNDVIVGIAINDAADVAVPPGVVTEIGPMVGFAGTMAVMDVALTTVKLVAAKPLNFTAVAPVKLVPVIVTFTPAAPDVGVNDVIVGAGIKVNDAADVAVPPGVVTVILPVVVLGTTAVIDVALTTLKLVAATPLNLTAVAPVKLVPVTVTVIPAPPEVGVNDVIVGIAINDAADVAVPPGVVTEIGPMVGFAGTMAVMDVALTTVKLVAARPLNFTAVAPVKLVPVIVTFTPAPPEVGVNDVIVGAGIKV